MLQWLHVRVHSLHPLSPFLICSSGNGISRPSWLDYSKLHWYIFRSARTSYRTFDVRPPVRPPVPQEKSRSPLQPYKSSQDHCQPIKREIGKKGKGEKEKKGKGEKREKGKKGKREKGKRGKGEKGKREKGKKRKREKEKRKKREKREKREQRRKREKKEEKKEKKEKKEKGKKGKGEKGKKRKDKNGSNITFWADNRSTFSWSNRPGQTKTNHFSFYILLADLSRIAF